MNMQAAATIKGAKISPRKVRVVADAIRGKSVAQAMQSLLVTKKHGASVLSKVLQSAVANAVNNKKLQADNLIVTQLLVQNGSFLRRFHSSARGRVRPYTKRTTHVTVIVAEKEMKAKTENTNLEEKKGENK